MGVRRAELGEQGWYPTDADRCRKAVESYMNGDGEAPEPAGARHGGIVPHAGWRFSGAVAGSVYRALSAQKPDAVIIYGMHLGPRHRGSIMPEGEWETPLGAVEIDADLAGPLLDEFDLIEETPEYHERDNTIEVQLPFVKHVFPDARVVPVGASPRSESLILAERVVELAAEQKKRLLVIGSTDLTHYGPNYGFAPKGEGEGALAWVKSDNDAAAIACFLAMDEDGVIEQALANHNACCPGAAACAIRTAKTLGSKNARQTAYATSADVMPSASFVGYAGVVF